MTPLGMARDPRVWMVTSAPIVVRPPGVRGRPWPDGFASVDVLAILDGERD